MQDSHRKGCLVYFRTWTASEDAVRCLAVSKSWREIVGAQDTYWTKACIQLGLPYYLIEEHVLCKKCCTSSVTPCSCMAARKQRLYTSQSSGVFSRLGRKGEYRDNVAIAITRQRAIQLLKFGTLHIEQCLWAGDMFLK